MKVMTILGTRPEIIRLSLIINKLDQLCSRHILVHTGQNFTGNLSDVFFQEMKVRTPDVILLDKQHAFVFHWEDNRSDCGFCHFTHSP